MSEAAVNPTAWVHEAYDLLRDSGSRHFNSDIQANESGVDFVKFITDTLGRAVTKLSSDADNLGLMTGHFEDSIVEVDDVYNFCRINMARFDGVSVFVSSVVKDKVVCIVQALDLHCNDGVRVLTEELVALQAPDSGVHSGGFQTTRYADRWSSFHALYTLLSKFIKDNLDWSVTPSV